MRFRPLCIDYHSEASQLLRERERKKEAKRPVIWLSRRLEAGDEQGDPEDSNDRSSESEHHCVTIRRSPQIRKRQRHGETSWIDNHREEESFTAVFEAPHSCTRWVEDWSVSSMAEKLMETNI
jgi:hypothetical protein